LRCALLGTSSALLPRTLAWRASAIVSRDSVPALLALFALFALLALFALSVHSLSISPPFLDRVQLLDPVTSRKLLVYFRLFLITQK
jgi:hypothetical protein